MTTSKDSRVGAEIKLFSQHMMGKNWLEDSLGTVYAAKVLIGEFPSFEPDSEGVEDLPVTQKLALLTANLAAHVLVLTSKIEELEGKLNEATDL